MKRYFNTREKAMKHLQMRRESALKRIEKSGDKIVKDSSTVIQQSVWKDGKRIKSNALNIQSTDEKPVKKWFAVLAIVTKKQNNMSAIYIDPESELLNSL